MRRSISGPATAVGMSMRHSRDCPDHPCFPRRNPQDGDARHRAGHEQRESAELFHPNPNPGGSGSPPVSDFIFSCNTVSALRLASVWAATMRSSRISFPDGLSSESSILTPLRSPLAVSVIVSMPPPAVPSTSIRSSSACIACILDCNCAACFIKPRKSAMASVLAVGRNIRHRLAGFWILRHADNLGAWKAIENSLNKGIALHSPLDFCLLGFRLRTNCRRALFLGYNYDPALAGPAGQFALKIVHERFRGCRLHGDFELAILATYKAHIAFKCHLCGDVALINGERYQFLE